MKFDLSPQVKTVIDKLQENGFEAFLVGGALRDEILGLNPTDYDVATSACPDEILYVFSDYPHSNVGIQHGTIAVMIDGVKLEITSFRLESNYSDRRHPQKVFFGTDLHQDLKRRDFTMNALAYDGKNLVDDFNGIEDINHSVIRTVGNPILRFEEDALRILRALRFSATLGFSIDNDCALAIHQCKTSLLSISKERVTEELLKLLCGDFAEPVVTEFADVLDVILPGVALMKHFNQNNAYHIYDVLTHTMKSLLLCPKHPILRLAALLHDMGKPQSYQQEENGYRHFRGHPEKSYELAKIAIQNLSLGKNDSETVLFLVLNHDEPIVGKSEAKRWLNRYGADKMQLLSQLKIADAATHGEKASGRVKMAEELKENLKQVFRQHECYRIAQLKIDGNDLMKIGYSGTEIGKELQLLLELVIDETIANDRESLINQAKK